MSLTFWLGSSSGLAGLDLGAVESNIIRIVNRGHDDSGRISGTGFWIQGSQVLVTNSHVVGDGQNVFVLVPTDQGVEQLPVEILQISDAYDIALLSVEGLLRPGLLLSPLDEIPKGQTIWASGYPEAADRGRFDRDNLEATLTSGIVNRTLHQSWERNGPLLTLLQHDAKLSHGNSGGPLLDTCGHVLGINTRIELAELALETYNYALSVNELRKLLDSWGIEYRNADSSCLFIVDSSEAALVWGLGGLALVLAASALILALRGPRERVIHVVESYTRYMQRLQLVHGEQALQSDAETAHRLAVPKPEGSSVSLKLINQEKTVCVIQCGIDKPCQQTLGRSVALCDQVLDDDTVSRRHAQVTWDPQQKQWYIEDLESRNGTSLNGRMLETRVPAPLHRDDWLVLGQLELKVALYDGFTDELKQV